MLSKVIQRWKSRPKSENVPFTRPELEEEGIPGKFRLMNVHPNRKARRFKALRKQVMNNRSLTPGRKDNRVLNKMSFFYLRMIGYRSGMKRA